MTDLPTLIAEQEKWRAARGGYLQVLPSGLAPSDCFDSRKVPGPTVEGRPTEIAEQVPQNADRLAVDFKSDPALAVRVDVYDGPDGKGFVLTETDGVVKFVAVVHEGKVVSEDAFPVEEVAIGKVA